MSLKKRLNPKLYLAAAIGWAVFAVVTLAALAAAHLAAEQAEQRARSDAEGLLAEFATQVRDALPMNLETRRSLLHALAAQLAASRKQNLAETRESLEAMRAQYPEYLWIGVVDGSGRTTVETADFSNQFNGVRMSWPRHGGRQPLVSDLHAAIQPRGTSPSERYIEMAIPLDSSVAKNDLIAAAVSWSWIEKLLERMQNAFNRHRELQVMLAGREGNILAGPDNWIGEKLTSATDVTEGGMYVVGRRAQVRLAGGMGLEWTVIVRQRADQALAPVRATRRSVFLIVFVAGLVAAVAAVQVTRLLTRRLASLAHEAEAIQQGRQRRLHVPPGADEVSRIGVTLVELVDHLQSEKQALVNLNAELDARVAERTLRISRMAEEAQNAAVTRERLRMARELHDTLAHSLMALLTQIRLVRKLHGRMGASELEAELDRAEGVAVTGLTDTRAAIKQMRDNEVRDLGLGPALHDLAKRFGHRTNLAVSIDIDPLASSWVDDRAETAFRLAEESLRNVERHARARSVAVKLWCPERGAAPGNGDQEFQERASACLEISDDGMGFDPEIPQPGHYGMRGMREQAELIGADLHVDSQPGHGTRITLHFGR
jgi:signal transduction histidine kinase